MTPSPSRSAVLGLALAGSVALPGCGEPSTPDGVLVRDSAGVTVIDHGRVQPDALPLWTLGETPLLRIGTVDGSADLQFHQIQDLVRLPDGSIAVADLSNTLRRFGAEGAHLWTTGGGGDGPGEFRAPFPVRPIATDSLVVWDVVSRRLSVFTLDGSFVRTAAFRGAEGTPVGHGLTGPRTLLIETRHWEPTRIDGHAALVSPSDFYLVHLDGAIVRELGRRILATQFQEVDEDGAFSPPMFGIAAVVAPGPGGLWFGNPQHYELRDEVGPDEPRTILRWEGPDRTVTPRDVEALMAWYLERLGDDPAVRRRLIEYGNTHPRSDRFPAYQALKVDRDGHLWVQDYVKPHADDGWRRWTVFSPDGTSIVGRLTHPARFEPHDIGQDWILGVEKDELEVEWVAMYELVREG